MNRISVLFILLIMFLSCGNSSNQATETKLFKRLQRASVLSNLSKEQKLMADKLDVFFYRNEP